MTKNNAYAIVLIMNQQRQTPQTDVATPQPDLEQRQSPRTYRRRRAAVGAGAVAAAALGVTGVVMGARALGSSEPNERFNGQPTGTYIMEPGDAAGTVAEHGMEGKDNSAGSFNSVTDEIHDQRPAGQTGFDVGDTVQVPAVWDDDPEKPGVQIHNNS